jgi:hypothetical protein
VEPATADAKTAHFTEDTEKNFEGTESPRRALRLRDVKPGVYSRPMYARKLKADAVIGGETKPVPLEWLDMFCMRNFTGSGEFDDTLPTGEGQLEAGLKIDPARLAAEMSDWFTKRGKGNGKPVEIRISERA